MKAYIALSVKLCILEKFKLRVWFRKVGKFFSALSVATQLFEKHNFLNFISIHYVLITNVFYPINKTKAKKKHIPPYNTIKSLILYRIKESKICSPILVIHNDLFLGP